MQKAELQEVSPLVLAVRKASLEINQRIFMPTEVNEIGNGLQEARYQKRKNPNHATVVVATHPSAGDFPRDLIMLLRNREFFTSPIVIADAWHAWNTYVDKFARMHGVTPPPVVTQDTLDKHKQGEYAPDRSFTHKRGFGDIAYFKVLREAAKQGGVLTVTPSAGIRDHLYQPSTHAVEFLLSAIDDFPFTLFCVGIDIKGNKGGINLGKKYTLNIGDAFNSEELLPMLKTLEANYGIPKYPTTKRPYHGIDGFLYETQFPKLVKRSYIRTKSMV